MRKTDNPAPTERGYRVRDVCEREGITRATAWRWIRKGVLTVTRVDPRTGVRVKYSDKNT
jgi:predicted site-specific integrase-resolvase